MRYLILIVLAQFAFYFAWAVNDAQKTFWTSPPTSDFQIKVLPDSKNVSVSVESQNKQMPKFIGITFYDQNGKQTVLELRNMTAPNPNQATFSGLLPPATKSFVGFELRIPFSSEKPTIIQSRDLTKITE